MDKTEFKAYLRNFSAHFPQAGEWVSKQAPEVLAVWFQDCFSCFSLADCLEANRMLFTAGEHFQWGDLPRHVIQSIKQINERRYVQEEPEVEHDAVHAHFDSSMKQALLDLELFQDNRRDAGNPVTPEERRAYVDEWFEKHDNEETKQKTYKCHHCQDTQWISLRDEKGRSYAGPCGYCDAGRARKTKYEKTGRKIAAIEPQVKEWEYK